MKYIVELMVEMNEQTKDFVIKVVIVGMIVLTMAYVYKAQSTAIAMNPSTDDVNTEQVPKPEPTSQIGGNLTPKPLAYLQKGNPVYPLPERTLPKRDKTKEGCPALQQDGEHWYVNPCLSKVPYGTRTAGWRYMEQIGTLNNELYSKCNKYGCGPFPIQSGLPKLERTIGQGQAKVNPDWTLACDAVTGGAEQYHNPEEYCRKNPWDRRCANNSGQFSVFTAEDYIPMRGCDQPAQAPLIHPNPNDTTLPGYCLAVDPQCQLGDTRGITVIQPSKLVPC